MDILVGVKVDDILKLLKEVENWRDAIKSHLKKLKDDKIFEKYLTDQGLANQ
ncbi:MAG: hypothetical protein ISR98_01435 [Parcubacteria group bacterium]|nr:hypothetical protein [Parcubacteria group bacterium]